MPYSNKEYEIEQEPITGHEGVCGKTLTHTHTLTHSHTHTLTHSHTHTLTHSHTHTLTHSHNGRQKDMLNVPAEVFVQLGFQVTEFFLRLPGVLLQLQTGLPGVVVSSSQGSAMAHLVTCAARGHSLSSLTVSGL